MTTESINQFISIKGKYFDPAMLPEIRRKLEYVDDSKTPYLLSMSLQDPDMILLIAILLGFDRFFLDDIALGVLKVCLCYGVGIWWLVDIFSAKRRAYEYNYKKFTDTLLLY